MQAVQSWSMSSKGPYQDREGRSIWWHGMEDWTTSDDGEVEGQIYFVVTRAMKLLCEKYFLFFFFFFLDYFLYPFSLCISLFYVTCAYLRLYM